MQEDKFLQLQESLQQAKEDFLKKEQQRIKEASINKEELPANNKIYLTPEEVLLVEDKVSSIMEAQQYKEGYLKSESQIRCEVVAVVLEERER